MQQEARRRKRKKKKTTTKKTKTKRSRGRTRRVGVIDADLRHLVLHHHHQRSPRCRKLRANKQLHPPERRAGGAGQVVRPFSRLRAVWVNPALARGLVLRFIAGQAARSGLEEDGRRPCLASIFFLG
jgi:hypothetical protein